MSKGNNSLQKNGKTKIFLLKTKIKFEVIMNKNTNMKNKANVLKTKATNLGFTLIELLLVIAASSAIGTVIFLGPTSGIHVK